MDLTRALPRVRRTVTLFAAGAALALSVSDVTAAAGRSLVIKTGPVAGLDAQFISPITSGWALTADIGTSEPGGAALALRDPSFALGVRAYLGGGPQPLQGSGHPFIDTSFGMSLTPHGSVPFSYGTLGYAWNRGNGWLLTAEGGFAFSQSWLPRPVAAIGIGRAF